MSNDDKINELIEETRLLMETAECKHCLDRGCGICTDCEMGHPLCNCARLCDPKIGTVACLTIIEDSRKFAQQKEIPYEFRINIGAHLNLRWERLRGKRLKFERNS